MARYIRYYLVLLRRNINGCVDGEINMTKTREGMGIKEERIKCGNCGKKTGFHPSDFDKGKDLSDVFCSEECRYNFETGNPGEEY